MSELQTTISKLRALFFGYLAQLNVPVVDDYLSDIPPGMKYRNVEKNMLPGLYHIDATPEMADPNAHELLDFLVGCKDQLRWGHTYTADDFGQHFVDNYGWMELFGTRGHLTCEYMSGGFLLIGPGLHYKEHRHEAEEIYVVLSGDARWQRDGGEFVQHPVGTVIHHASNVLHSTKAGEKPMLAIYLWRKGELVQRSEFT